MGGGPFLKEHSTGEYYDGESGRTYSPEDPTFGGAYLLRLRNGTELLINAQTGELSTVTDLSGQTLTFTGMGIEHSSGRSIQFERDNEQRITAVIDPAGKKIVYKYDDQGDLISVTNRAQETTTFVYRDDRPHFLDKVLDPYGREAARTVYDDEGRIKRIVDAAGREIVYEWNGDTKVQKITDQLGHTTVLTLDGRGNALREENPEGGVTLRTYDADDNLLSETVVVGLEDATSGETNDLTTVYTYQSGTDLVETVTQVVGRLDSEQNGETDDLVTSYTYNQHGQLETTTSGGVITGNHYDDRGLLAWAKDANGQLTHFTYDTRGNVEEMGNHNGTLLFKNDPNQYGELLSSDPASGRTSYFDYDLNGDQVGRWYLEGEGTARVQILDVTRYDEARRVVGTIRAVLPDGQFITNGLATAVIPQQYIDWTTSTEYNEAGQIERQVDRFGRKTEYVYNRHGHQIEVRSQSADENGNPVWLVSWTVYDAAGRTVLATEPHVEGSGETITGTKTEYDKTGRVTKTTRLSGMKIAFTGSGALLTSVIEDEGTVVSASGTGYDNAGRATVRRDDYDRETRYTYNRFGETVETRTEAIDENGEAVWLVTRTAYDELGRAEYVTDRYVERTAPDGTVTVDAPIYATQTVFDEKGRIEQTIRLEGVEVSLSGGETSLTNGGTELWRTRTVFDEQGHVQRTIAADGQITEYEYDHLNRQTAVIGHPLPAAEVGLTGYAAGTLVRLRSQTVYDDATGQVKTERTNIRQIKPPDAPVQIDESAAQETTYEYDEFGNVVKTTFADPDGAAGPLERPYITATYDAFGRKTSETNQMNQTRSFEYDADGRLIRVLLADLDPDPQVELRPTYEYGYDGRGNQTSITDPMGRETRFTFDERGRQLARTLPLGVETASVPDDFTETFEYDLKGRLVLHVTFEGVHVRSVYDESTGCLSERLFFDNQTDYDQWLAEPEPRVTIPNETWSYNYDAFGREVQVTIAEGATVVRTESRSYDSQWRIASIASPEGIVNYEYDALGRKTRTYTVDQANTANVTNDTHYKYDALGRLSSVEVHERNDVLVDADANAAGLQPEATSYAYDLVGNLDEQTNPNGMVTDYQYDGLNRLERLTHYESDGDRLAEFTYTVREGGKRESASEKRFVVENGVESVVSHGQFGWTYDALGRLTDEVFTDVNGLRPIWTAMRRRTRTTWRATARRKSLITATTARPTRRSATRTMPTTGC